MSAVDAPVNKGGVWMKLTTKQVKRTREGVGLNVTNCKRRGKKKRRSVTKRQGEVGSVVLFYNVPFRIPPRPCTGCTAPFVS